MKISAFSLVAKLALFGSKNLEQRSPHYRLYQRLMISFSLSLAAGCSLTNVPSIAAHPLSDRSAPTQSQTAKPSLSTPKLPIAIAKAVLQDATNNWGLKPNTGKVVNAKPMSWAYGCERSTFPHPCDPVLVKGWQVAIASGSQRWVYHTDNNGSFVRLYSRENTASNLHILPAKTQDAVRKLGAAHLEVSPSQLLFTQIKQQAWRDRCLDLPSPAERCEKATISGWRVTVEGKPGQRQIYRVDNTGQQIRTEAIAPQVTSVMRKAPVF